MSPRKSKRTSAVLKRRLLEAKLRARKERSLRRKNKSRSKSKNFLESEAAKNEVSPSLRSVGENSEESHHSQESLEWDHSDETAPTFVTNTWDSDELEVALQNLYHSLGETSDKENNYPLESTPIKTRRNTSTDYNFLCKITQHKISFDWKFRRG